MSYTEPLRLAGILAVIICAASAPAYAEAVEPKLSGQITLLSDGIYRGVSQTDGQPQYIAGLQLAYGKVFIGTLFKSMRDRTTGVDNQTQALIGYKTAFDGYDVTARAIYKQYNGTKPGIDNAFMEYEVNVARKLAPNTTARLNLAYTPDNYGKAKEATYAEVVLEQKIWPSFSLQAGTGFRHNSGSVDYSTVLFGATYTTKHKQSVSLTFTNTDRGALGDKYGDSLFLTVSQKY
ncbi:TorF family putative porin [Asticcacaulis sp. 201]|uniref:TorF family putative porin n=1 Tax=Asticcacaulis sp. 201 TaxID=3028787 RepID=UPI002916B6A3|nr:TorF family putative porin [Asticcacaulis sp. 201]MDV6330912.1 TorF family putative porin [Asticcacaulis sp. 201]